MVRRIRRTNRPDGSGGWLPRERTRISRRPVSGEVFLLTTPFIEPPRLTTLRMLREIPWVVGCPSWPGGASLSPRIAIPETENRLRIIWTAVPGQEGRTERHQEILRSNH